MTGWPSSFWEYLSRSTMKREATSIVMLWLLSMATYLMVTAATFEQKLQVLGIFAMPIMGLFGLAFGADFVAKQTTIAGPATGQQDSSVEVKTPPQPVKVEGVVEGTIKVDEEPKING